MNKPRLDQGVDYERGFVDGMSKQAQSSVDKAVNSMSQRTWVGLTDDEICKLEGFYDFMTKEEFFDAIRKVEAKLKDKNT